MLPVPLRLETDPAFAPLLALCENVLLTGQELAKHWRYAPGYLSNLRQAGKGPPYIKLDGGAVRYRVSDALAYELRGQEGVSQEQIALALATVPGLSPSMRAMIEVHLEEHLFPRKVMLGRGT